MDYHLVYKIFLVLILLAISGTFYFLYIDNKVLSSALFLIQFFYIVFNTVLLHHLSGDNTFNFFSHVFYIMCSISVSIIIIMFMVTSRKKSNFTNENPETSELLA
jgi:hypothetical protein